MADTQHVTALHTKPDHKQEEGCISSHERGFINPAIQYPNCAYRMKGYQEIVGNPAKLQLYVKRPEWAFVGINYKFGSKPFSNQYHHIMPSGALKDRLTNDELSILQASRYNINEGINLIILPCVDSDALELGLPVHAGYHKEYNDDCIRAINRMKRDISELTADGKHDITDANVDFFRAFLRGWEQEEFWVIVKYGQEEASRGLIPRMKDGMVPMAL
jgi:hypothetical protein